MEKELWEAGGEGRRNGDPCEGLHHKLTKESSKLTSKEGISISRKESIPPVKDTSEKDRLG